MSVNGIGNPYTKSLSPDTKLDMPLAARSAKLKPCLIDPDGYAEQWHVAMNELQSHHREARLKPVVVGAEERTITPNPRTYTHKWLLKSYAKILDGDRELRARMDNCHTVFVTLTASAYTSNKFTAPVDFYHDLDSSWESIYSKLYYELTTKRDIDWEYLLVDGVHDGQKVAQAGSDNQCYPHRHALFYVDGNVSQSDFRPIIDKHVEHCSLATEEQHRYDKAIRVRKASEQDLYPIGKEDRRRGLVSPSARDMASHIPDLRMKDGQLVGTLSDKMFAGLMYSMRNKSWRDSKGFRRAYRDRFEERTGQVHPDRYESSEDTELIGWKGPDGFIPNSSDSSGGGSTKLETCEPIEGFYS